MNEELEIFELPTKLGGIILKKAELNDNFEKVYLRVFEKMVEIQNFQGEEILEVLGEVGG